MKKPKLRKKKKLVCAFGYKKCIGIECSCWDYFVGKCGIPKIESHGIWFYIERVSDGWLYWYDDKATFIPFSDEFREDK